MSAIIDDELVEMVARAIFLRRRGQIDDTDGAWLAHKGERSPEFSMSVSDARAALAVAVPHVVAKCARVAESHRLGEALIRHKMSEVKQVMTVSDTIAAAIRSLSTETKA